jgi:hypothetical protein
MRHVTFSEYLKEKRSVIDRLDWVATFGLAAVAIVLPLLGLRGRDQWDIWAGYLVGLVVYWLTKRLRCPRCQGSLPPKIARDELPACPFCGLQRDEMVWVE